MVPGFILNVYSQMQVVRELEATTPNDQELGTKLRALLKSTPSYSSVELDYPSIQEKK